MAVCDRGPRETASPREQMPRAIADRERTRTACDRELWCVGRTPCPRALPAFMRASLAKPLLLACKPHAPREHWRSHLRSHLLLLQAVATPRGGRDRRAIGTSSRSPAAGRPGDRAAPGHCDRAARDTGTLTRGATPSRTLTSRVLTSRAPPSRAWLQPSAQHQQSSSRGSGIRPQAAPDRGPHPHREPHTITSRASLPYNACILGMLCCPLSHQISCNLVICHLISPYLINQSHSLLSQKSRVYLMWSRFHSFCSIRVITHSIRFGNLFIGLCYLLHTSTSYYDTTTTPAL